MSTQDTVRRSPSANRSKDLSYRGEDQKGYLVTSQQVKQAEVLMKYIAKKTGSLKEACELVGIAYTMWGSRSSGTGLSNNSVKKILKAYHKLKGEG